MSRFIDRCLPYSVLQLLQQQLGEALVLEQTLGGAGFMSAQVHHQAATQVIGDGFLQQELGEVAGMLRLLPVFFGRHMQEDPGADGGNEVHPLAAFLALGQFVELFLPVLGGLGVQDVLGVEQAGEFVIHKAHKRGDGGLIQRAGGQRGHQRDLGLEVFDVLDLLEELRQRARRGALAGDGLGVVQDESDAARIHAGGGRPFGPGLGIERQGEVQHAGEHGVVHGRDGIVGPLGVGGGDDLPLLGQLPGEHLEVLQQLHDAAEDAVIGAVDVVQEEDAGTFGGGHPFRRGEHGVFIPAIGLVGRVIVDGGNAVQVAHFLELRRGAVGKLPAATGGEAFHEVGLADAVRAPDADRGAATAGFADLVVAVEDVGEDVIEGDGIQFGALGGSIGHKVCRFFNQSAGGQSNRKGNLLWNRDPLCRQSPRGACSGAAWWAPGRSRR